MTHYTRLYATFGSAWVEDDGTLRELVIRDAHGLEVHVAITNDELLELAKSLAADAITYGNDAGEQASLDLCGGGDMPHDAEMFHRAEPPSGEGTDYAAAMNRQAIRKVRDVIRQAEGAKAAVLEANALLQRRVVA